jgi:hypothetical protein
LLKIQALRGVQLCRHESSTLTSVIIPEEFSVYVFTVFFPYLLYFPLLPFLKFFSSVSIIAVNFLHARDSVFYLFHFKMHAKVMRLLPASLLIFSVDFWGSTPVFAITFAVCSGSALGRGRPRLSLSAKFPVALSHLLNLLLLFVRRGLLLMSEVEIFMYFSGFSTPLV